MMKTPTFRRDIIGWTTAGTLGVAVIVGGSLSSLHTQHDLIHSALHPGSAAGSTSSAIRTVDHRISVTSDIHPKAGSCHISGGLPDPHCTPGSIDKSATDVSVCSSWPTPSIPAPLAAQERTAYGVRSSTPVALLIPAGLGGGATSSNLWPVTSLAKTAVDNDLHTLVCHHAIPLALAQESLASHWTTALSSLGWHREGSQICNVQGTCFSRPE